MSLRKLTIILILSLFTITSVCYSIEIVLFEEGFDDLELGPTIAEAVPGKEVWTNVPPDGWSVESDMPEGMPEWTGWAFADATWWMQTAADQERNRFVNGNANEVIAIADPDEWDDLGAPGGKGTFNSWLSTPEINISGVAADSLVLYFDSSWRPEDTQNAELTVSFDGGDEMVIIRMESHGTTTFYTEPQNGVEETFPDNTQVNEEIEINIPNPAGAKKIVITWSVIDATNDWWWAIDNISLKTTEKIAVEKTAEKLSTVWGYIKISK